MAELDKHELAIIVNRYALDGKHIDNPYHNHIHCKNVYEMGDRLLTLMDMKPSDEFIWASFFHDYDHTGGECHDDINIQLAIDGVTKAIESTQTIPNFPLVNIDTVVSMIQCTKYIGTFPNEPKTIEEQCLRDADLMTIFAGTDTAIKLLNGLYAEIRLKNPLLTKQEFVKMNTEFLSNAKYYTEPAKELVEKYLTQTLKDLEPLLLQT